MVIPKRKNIMTEDRIMISPRRMARSSPGFNAVTVFFFSRRSYSRIFWNILPDTPAGRLPRETARKEE
ncbi:hypothetical protein JZ751_013755 [Albula glossodonta]|uniref:Uncharacterized protein n=1 Tax=Albula glossodonta TaxID=121402 RepID=A0A8T2NTA2_9TELE|nr:hypothetical protein JZ751_013755 [Albula glossodonta]